MRIRVTLSIDVDPAEWAAEYGTDTTPAAVRTDVRSYLTDNMTAAAIDQGILTVTVT